MMRVGAASIALLLSYLCRHETVGDVVSYYGHEDPDNNFVKNWDFETDLEGWKENNARISRVTGGNTGQMAVKVDSRIHADGGLVMQLNTNEAGIQSNTDYYYSMFFKQLTNNDQDPYILIKLLCQFTLESSSTTMVIAKLPYQRADGTWKQFGGDFQTPSEAFSKMTCFMRINAHSVSYMMDTIALTTIVRHRNWKVHLGEKIERNRKSDVTLSVSLPRGTALSDTQIKVELIRHEFCFGMAIRGLLMLKQGGVYANYQKFVTDNFNCLGFENSIKWRQMEPNKGEYHTSWVTGVMERMESYNMTYRGHAVYWNVQKNNPRWVKELKGDDLVQAVSNRADHVGRLLKGKLIEWDVLNEYEHGHWFEETTGKLNLLEFLMRKMKAIDPDARMLVNDYEVVRNGQKTSAVVSRCKSLRDRGLPCDGIGVQSHLRTLPIDVYILMRRVQITVSLGLPVTITEFSVHDADEAVRAVALEQAFMVYFSEPLVQGIYSWGFSDQPGFSFTDDMYLTNGPEMTPNAAGRVMLYLIKKKWHTKKAFIPTSLHTTNTFSAFHGTYKVTVTTAGQTVYENNDFYASKDRPNVWQVTV